MFKVFKHLLLSISLLKRLSLTCKFIKWFYDFYKILNKTLIKVRKTNKGL